MKPLCVYHENCLDGFAAAWCVRHALGPDGVEFYPGVYGDPPPDMTGRDVILVDFSYKRPVLDEMAKVAHSILILDHHKSAAEDLAGLPTPSAEVQKIVVQGYGLGLGMPPGACALFDMNRSGAGIAWDFFHPGRPRPVLIDYIEDRDLWRFKLRDSKLINAALFSYPYDFEQWDHLMLRASHSFAREGAAILRKQEKDVAELVAATKRRVTIGGHDVWGANLPYTYASDAANLMAQGEPFAACWWETPRGRVFSLRSDEHGLDVSQIAKAYGGGGHQHAAGFRLSYGVHYTGLSLHAPGLLDWLDWVSSDS